MTGRRPPLRHARDRRVHRMRAAKPSPSARRAPRGVTERGRDIRPAPRRHRGHKRVASQAGARRFRHEGVVFYRKTRQRVRVPFDDETIAEAERAIAKAWATAAATEIPPPLIDSPKCPGCSLVGICLPDETWRLQAHTETEGVEQLDLFEGRRRSPNPAVREPRLLVAPRADQKPLYLNSQRLRVGKSGGVLRIKERDKVVQEVRINAICQVSLMGSVQISTQAVQALCEAEIPVCYFSQGGWFYGVTSGLNTKNVFLRQAQFRLSDESWYCLRLARQFVAGKIRNQRTMLRRNHVEPPTAALRELKWLVGRAETAGSLSRSTPWPPGYQRNPVLCRAVSHTPPTIAFFVEVAYPLPGFRIKVAHGPDSVPQRAIPGQGGGLDSIISERV